MAMMHWPGLPFLVVTTLAIITVPKSTSSPNYVTYSCSNSSTYTTNSAFSNNLNILLQSLTTNAANNPTGFNATEVGSGTNNAVYGLFMCRGDQNTSDCKDCVSTAVRELPQRLTCPMSKIGIVWYDECMLRYDNQVVVGRLDQSPNVVLANSADISGNQTSFADLLGNLLKNLVSQAANDPQTGKKYANGVVDFTSLQSVYAMVQCTPDLSAGDCNQCLISEIGQLNSNKQGGQVLEPSCRVRYELHPFLKGAFNSTLQPSSTPTATIENSKGKSNVSIGVIIAIVASVVLLVGCLLALGLCLIKKKAKKYEVVNENGEHFSFTESLQYDLETLRSATNDFSEDNKLGEGGFGGVYKGTLIDGREIAVKKLSRSSSQGIQEFKNEVLLVAKLQHRNLVRLFGFCFAEEEKLLIYEYVPKKSLDNFLFDPEKQGLLNWGTRSKIIQGIARGMLYLHQDSQVKIIHRDLKASNILLDMNMNPKIADFGMARIFGVDQTQANTSRVVGTYGYMAPEYAMQGQISTKSDVYSFGVLMLEIISGKRNNAFFQPDNSEDLISYAWKTWKSSMPLEFVDPSIRSSCSVHEVMRCLHIGLLSIQHSVEARPTMATIVLTLDSYSVTLPVPEQPTLFLKSNVDLNLSNGIGSDQSSSKSIHWSRNSLSISEFDPR